MDLCIFIAGPKTTFIPLSLNSFPWAFPTSYINVLLKVEAVFIGACQLVDSGANLTPLGPSCKHRPWNLSSIGSIAPTQPPSSGFFFKFCVPYNNETFSFVENCSSFLLALLYASSQVMQL